ncbi:MAG: DNA-binding response regulator [Acidimicrobiales bacterium]|jgi:DNA-binding response OmpR family regulator
MQPLIIWPDPPPSDLVRVLDMAGLPWTGIKDEADARDGLWSGAIVAVDEAPDAGFAIARSLRRGDLAIAPMLLIVRGTQLSDLDGRHDIFDDFCVSPAHPAELEARVRHLLAAESGLDLGPEIVQYESLVLNLETYQAVIEGQPLDLTYMEYELLKFLASNPGRVFTREILLSRVWGYEYYGGARTVDVHIRRLRAKLGEEHAGMIQTVRSVGYKFGESRWGN